MAEFGFPRSARLLSRADFDAVFAQKRSAANDQLVVYVAESTVGNSRLGLVVGRRVGNAVVRNRWKRAIREAFRLMRPEMPVPLDVVVLPRHGARPSTAAVQASLERLISKALRKHASA